MAKPVVLKLVDIKEPWTPAQATDRIRSIASGKFDIAYKQHAKDQLAERGLIMGDLMYLVKNGFVYSRLRRRRVHRFGISNTMHDA
jgi:hypothetical protein